MNNINNHSIIFFDGVCNLCNSSVNYIIKKDASNYFKFASLQSEFAEQFFKKHHHLTNSLNTIILFENNNFYTKSTAALKIAKHLNGIVKYSYYCKYIPIFIRDFFYDIISHNRYSWFGKKDTCSVPTPILKDKFLD